MISPDPKDYIDCVQFMRDMHKVILHNCAALDTLLDDAENEGVFASFAKNPEWNSAFDFFQNDAPLHERDEEHFLFPALATKVPRVGFQQPNAPIRFLIEGHDILKRETEALVHDWKIFREQKRDPADIAASHAKHVAEDNAFIAIGRELVSLYRDHIATEEQRVYSVADKVLSGDERFTIMEMIKSAYGSEAITSIPEFEKPQFSDPSYEPHYFNTEVQSDGVIDGEYENDNDEGSDILL
jgi:hemerythrin-like domain-containing protein